VHTLSNPFSKFLQIKENETLSSKFIVVFFNFYLFDNDEFIF